MALLKSQQSLLNFKLITHPKPPQACLPPKGPARAKSHLPLLSPTPEPLMQSAIPNPQITMVNLTKELHRLLWDPLLHKSPSPLPHLNTRGLAGQNPSSSSTLPQSSIQIYSSSQKHPPSSLLKGIWAASPDSTAGVATPQGLSLTHINRPTRPLFPLLSLSRLPHPKPPSIHLSRKQDVSQ